MKLKPISLECTGRNEQGHCLYRVKFAHDRKGEVEFVFTVEETIVTVVSWEKEFWFETFEDSAPTDALLQSILKFHEARNLSQV
jgi:hypothetical protein